ncbi:uncharacterized protein LOC143622733 [Bidens hawaiensis]|uniref:uncharacterized protein LOC143622733 n=1 Tax=Bidens hawaiensis TaxID=980011 RepID=UPI0040494984
MDRLPTRKSVCPLCEMSGETADHIMTGCGVSSVVWDHISRWCKFPPIFGFTVRDLLELYKIINVVTIKKEALHGIIIIACWRIWKARNEKVFEGKAVNVK